MWAIPGAGKDPRPLGIASHTHFFTGGWNSYPDLPRPHSVISAKSVILVKTRTGIRRTKPGARCPHTRSFIFRVLAPVSAGRRLCAGMTKERSLSGSHKMFHCVAKRSRFFAAGMGVAASSASRSVRCEQTCASRGSPRSFFLDSQEGFPNITVRSFSASHPNKPSISNTYQRLAHAASR